MITPAQCRAARALLEFTQAELASLAGLGLSTVVDFERGRRAVSEEVKRLLCSAIEEGGVILIAENGGGAGVRLKKTEKRVKPR